MTSIGSWVSLAFVSVLAAQSPAVAAQLASKEDAVVSSTDTGWILTNALVTYAIGFDANGDLVLQDLRRTGDTLSWRPSPVRDTVFRVEDRELGLTRNNAAGFRHVGAEVADIGIGLELRLTFEDLRDGLRARRVYAIHPQVALVEAWTELESINGRSTTVSDLGLAPAGRRRCAGHDRRRSLGAAGDRRAVRGPSPRRVRGRAPRARGARTLDAALPADRVAGVGARHARLRADVVGRVADRSRRQARWTHRAHRLAVQHDHQRDADAAR